MSAPLPPPEPPHGVLQQWARDVRDRVTAETGAGPEDLYAGLRVIGDDAEAWSCPVSIGSPVSAAECALRRHVQRREREGRLL